MSNERGKGQHHEGVYTMVRKLYKVYLTAGECIGQFHAATEQIAREMAYVLIRKWYAENYKLSDGLSVVLDDWAHVDYTKQKVKAKVVNDTLINNVKRKYVRQ